MNKQASEYWLGYAKGGKELEVMDQLQEAGIDYWRGIRIEFERRGKNRTAEPVTYSALPNYIFLSPDPTQFQDLGNIKYLAKNLQYMTALSMHGLQRYQKRVQSRLDEAHRAIDSREAIALYKQGEIIKIESGPFSDNLARFTEQVQKHNWQFPMIRADVEMMGRTVPVLLDPLDVKSAG